MANKSLFASSPGSLPPETDALNEAGGRAYTLPPRQALAQLAATGCLNSTWYASESEQLSAVLALCETLEPEFVARTALFCRRRGHMKDMPALLAAILATRAPELLEAIFDRVIDDARMLRSFVQILRSGTTGRKSLGTRPRNLVRRWLDSRDDDAVFRAAVGASPSLADLLRMVHPRPATPSREALYGYLLHRPHDAARLPALVQQFGQFKKTLQAPMPDVPFQMLTALPLTDEHWAGIAASAGWQMTRMNLNTFARHGVFQRPGLTETIAARLRDPGEVAGARVFPYQLMVASSRVNGDVPVEVRQALQDALELTLDAVPAVEGQVHVLIDVSSSMSAPASGYRRGATTVVRCIDVAALLAAALLRRSRQVRVLPFSDELKPIELDPRDSVVANAQKLAALGGGGTCCSLPLRHLNAAGAPGDLVIFVSDNQSWMDGARGRATESLHEWAVFRERNPAARLACLDLQPYVTTQLPDRPDILNIGGFSDRVFELLGAFAAGSLDPGHWVGEIERVVL